MKAGFERDRPSPFYAEVTVTYRVYLIENLQGRRYIGISSDVLNRLSQHNRGESQWTAKFRPWAVKWISRQMDLTAARKLENLMKKQKGGSGLQSLLDSYGS
jgi:putative endonuclease